MPAQKRPNTKNQSPKSKNTGMAALAYVLFLIPLLTDAKNEPYVKFHTKQAIVLVGAAVIWAVASKLLVFIPILGWLIAGLAGIVIDLILVILWIMGVLNALNGQEKELPVIGKYAKELRF